jgi:hypothetical protein
MRNICVGIAAIAVSVGTMAVAAQGRNFSGTWVVDSEKTMAAAPTAAAGGGAVMARSAGGGAGGGGETRVMAGGGGIATAGGGGGERRAVAGGQGGAAGGVMVSADTVISMDANAFSLEQGGVKNSYPLNGSEVTVEMRGLSGKASAAWQGDVLVITTTIERPDGPVTTTARWSIEGDSLVRDTGRKTFYKRK